MEVDGDFEMVTIPEPAGAFLYGCNFGVQSLRHGVGYAMLEIGQHIGQVPRDQFRSRLTSQATQGTPQGRQTGVAFSLATLFWRSKRK